MVDVPVRDVSRDKGDHFQRFAGPRRSPPLGVALSVDVEVVERDKGTGFKGRVRWMHPTTRHREGIKRVFDSRAEADAWLARMKQAAQTGLDPGQALASYVDHIGDRWTRGIDTTSTYDPYVAGLRRRVLPTLGHLPVAMITAGLVDRAIDGWKREYARSTVKNTVAVLVLVLDEAVRDGIMRAIRPRIVPGAIASATRSGRLPKPSRVARASWHFPM